MSWLEDLSNICSDKISNKKIDTDNIEDIYQNPNTLQVIIEYKDNSQNYIECSSLIELVAICGKLNNEF